jgi:putative ABC transport system ATP-binding protein
MVEASAERPMVVVRQALKRREQGGMRFELSIPEVTLGVGDFVAVVGDSGCGKSTLLDLLALVSRPTECERFSLRFDVSEQGGEFDVAGLWRNGDEHGLAALRKAHLGYVLQTGGLLPFLTVAQNIYLPARIAGRPDRDYADRLARRFGVDRLLSKKPQFLSGGQRQRVAILRAMGHRPQLILADEPTAAVDRQRAEEIVADFHALAKESGTTIVMVTHDRALVAPVADYSYGFRVRDVSASTTRSTVVRHESAHSIDEGPR